MTDHDPVNHPSHYTSGGIECIDAIEAAMTPAEASGFRKGNAMKYIWRAGRKNDALEDLRKAQWYLDREVFELEYNGRDETPEERDETGEEPSDPRYSSYVVMKKAQEEFDAGQQRVLDKQEAASVGSPNEAPAESTRRTVTASPAVDRLARLAREQFGRTDAG